MLPPSEITDELKTAAAAETARQSSSVTDRLSARHKFAAATTASPPLLSELEGGRVASDSGISLAF